MKETNKVLNYEIERAGDIEKEINAIRQLQKENADGIYTFSAGCDTAFTLICC